MHFLFASILMIPLQLVELQAITLLPMLQQPVETAIGLAMIATAVPVYFLTIRVKQRPAWMIHLTDRSTNWLQRLLLVVPPSKEQ